MPRTRSCKDLSTDTKSQSMIKYPVRKLRSADVNKKLVVTPSSKVTKTRSKMLNSVCTNTENKENELQENVLHSKRQNVTPLKENVGIITDTICKSPAKRKLYCDKENITPEKLKKSEKVDTPKSLIKERFHNNQDSSYNDLCKVLHTSAPKKLIAREKELKFIKGFIDNTVTKSKSGSMYMSGAPGTGKTACLKKVIDECKECKKLQCIYFNCMSLKLSQNVFVKLAQEVLKDPKPITIKESMKCLEKKFTTSKSKILLILDEIDQLESKNQDVLYKLFEMPFLKNSQLVLIGIANALDLTDRILPRFQSMSLCKPLLLQFPPYTKDEIQSILEERVKESHSDVVDPAAVTFCARKVSAMSGDARKALEIMRRSVEFSQQLSNKTCLSPAITTNNTDTIKKRRISVANVAKVCSDVYGSKVTNSSGINNGFPMQQKLVVCTLMLLQKEKKMTDAPVMKLYDWYNRICNARHITSVNHQEMMTLCSLLESQGIINIKKSKEGRNDKVSLRLQENEIEFALQDKTLVASILADGLP